jgi:Zn finger protein HypA/HybF involved in hydrogenase expression
MKKITQKRFETAMEKYEGWCTTCCRFTRNQTEPDAEEYDCWKCNGKTVMGAEQALLLGEIEL